MAKPRRAKHAQSSDAFYSAHQLDDRTEERQALLDEALAGSDGAHVVLVDSYRPELIRYFAERLPDALRQKADPEDLAQNATLRAWQKFAGFIGRELKSYWAWLRQICSSLVKRLVRWFSQAKRDVSREEVLDQLRMDDEGGHAYCPRQKPAHEICEALETAGQLEAALAQLRDDERLIVRLHLNDGLSFS